MGDKRAFFLVSADLATAPTWGETVEDWRQYLATLLGSIGVLDPTVELVTADGLGRLTNRDAHATSIDGQLSIARGSHRGAAVNREPPSPDRATPDDADEGLPFDEGNHLA